MRRASGVLAFLAGAALIVGTTGIAVGQGDDPPTDEAEAAMPTSPPFERFDLAEIIHRAEAEEGLTRSEYQQVVREENLPEDDMSYPRTRDRVLRHEDIFRNVIAAWNRADREGPQFAQKLMRGALAKYRHELHAYEEDRASLNDALAHLAEFSGWQDSVGAEALVVYRDVDPDVGTDPGMDPDVDADPDAGGCPPDYPPATTIYCDGYTGAEADDPHPAGDFCADESVGEAECTQFKRKARDVPWDYCPRDPCEYTCTC